MFRYFRRRSAFIKEDVLFLKKKNQKNFCSFTAGIWPEPGSKVTKVFARFFQKAPLSLLPFVL
jgi:hypothetical protein